MIVENVANSALCIRLAGQSHLPPACDAGSLLGLTYDSEA